MTTHTIRVYRRDGTRYWGHHLDHIYPTLEQALAALRLALLEDSVGSVTIVKGLDQ